MNLKRLPARAMLTLPNGSSVEVERIGSGRYTTAWRNNHFVYLQTHEDDRSKEILLRIDGEHLHIPRVERLEWDERNKKYEWYREPLYKPLTAKSGDAWKQFKILHKYYNGAYSEAMKRDSYRWDAYTFNGVLREDMENDDQLPQSLRDAVIALIDEAGDYGQYMVEITKKNSAVDDDGRLILLDPLFNLQELRDERQRILALAFNEWVARNPEYLKTLQQKTQPGEPLHGGTATANFRRTYKKELKRIKTFGTP